MMLLSAAALSLALASVPPARAADDHSHHAAAAKKADEAKPSAVRVRYDDSVLTDQNGKPWKFKSEVVADRIVVMDFVYTTCTTICPVLTTLLVQVQDGLEPAAREDVRLVTVSVDPARDTPARMKEYGEKFGVKPGWLWLTGPTGRVNEVLKGFGAYAPNFEDHPPVVLVGDGRSGQWTRFYGFVEPKQVLAKVQEMRAARGNGGHAGHDGHAAGHKH